MDGDLRPLVKLAELVASYAAIFGLAFVGTRGGGRLAMAARPEATRAAARFLETRPGRCLLAGAASFLAGWAALGVCQQVAPPAAVLVLAIWVRAAFFGLTAWLYLRGRELQAFETPETVSEAEALERGTWAGGAAFLPPLLGWAFFTYAVLLGLGAETLRWWTGGTLPPPDAPRAVP